MKSLLSFNTFGIAANAENIVEITELSQFHAAWRNAQNAGQPVLLLGQGSNVLFLKDFRGTVLVNRLSGIERKEDENFHYLHVNGGENWHHLVEWSLEQGIFGLENLALIPGCAGSAPVQNIGAYGVEFKDVCDYVEVLDLAQNKTFRLTNAECRFGYRDSVFKHRYGGDFIVVGIGLKLTKNWKPVLKYGALNELDPSAVSAKRVFDEVCAIRRAKLPDPQQIGNAGSFFKNPIVTEEQYQTLRAEYPTMPCYPQSDGFVKLAAGWLIDQCHLKGYQLGGAAVHEKQALVLVNKGNATGSDVVELAHHIRQAVAAKFDVYLVPEVRFIGEKGEVNAENTIS
ncbi:UDP-N-acetylmuramate dehydrogenase [Bisgaard Taxon 10/6]|uniref:UDP-N-acetylenolpyruvoylglucosamine reductase n=1 Tax=Exercitatus varius TaxID=67857 RepID=A0ABT6EQ10_9PAST|nr:UDP-N-acetylmuramate dehydrogenase [Exercitatus varius]MDG2940271.1 UDP-N-acetylmuramate dehydrogenase [Exercitatus varius]MDG2945637.1 UDP-N-acetylmuramate dehydrogenase [Exercitatus varius]